MTKTLDDLKVLTKQLSRNNNTEDGDVIKTLLDGVSTVFKNAVAEIEKSNDEVRKSVELLKNAQEEIVELKEEIKILKQEIKLGPLV